jgi:hypothetical protein
MSGSDSTLRRSSSTIPGSSPTMRPLSLIPRTLVGRGLCLGPGTAPWRHQAGLPPAGSGRLNAMSRFGRVDISRSKSGCTAARDGARTVPVAGYDRSPGPDRRGSFGPLPCHRSSGLTELSSMNPNGTSSATVILFGTVPGPDWCSLISPRYLRSPSICEQLRGQSREAPGESESEANRLRGDC